MRRHSLSHDRRSPRARACAVAVCLMLAGADSAWAQPALVRCVLAGGGGHTSSATLRMRSTLGQTAIGQAGSGVWTAEIGFWLPLSTDISAVPGINPSAPDRFELGPCGPNPTSGSAGLVFAVPVPAHVTIRLFNVAGREIKTLADADYPPGRHELWLESRGLPSGVYLCRMTADGYRSTYRLILAR